MTKVRFNFIRFVAVIFLSLFLSLDLIAQYAYIGRVSDLLTDDPVSNVLIYNKQFQTTSVTEKDGVFILDYNNSRKENKYQILFNVFFAPADENVSLRLFSVDGKSILQTGYLGKGGKFLFPALKPGVYILAVESENKSETIKIFSNGNELSYYQNQLKKTENNQSDRDTLVFSKEGYYGVEIAVPRSDTIIHIKLLQKSENDINFLNGLPEYKAFNLLQSSPFVTNHGEVESVKFIYNRNNGKIYFMNSKRYEFHYDFAVKFLAYNKGIYHFNMVQYSASKERYLFPGSLNYYKAPGIYVLRFYPGDEMGCAEINEILETLYTTTYLKNKIYLFPNNSSWEKCSGTPIITADELYEGQNYQALNLTKGFGYLRKVELGDMGNTYLGKHEIIVLNGIPNDVSVVAGIITTEFQTPLSHINILSHNRGTPNMALRDGWTNPKLDSLMGELVYLEVLSDSFVIRKATRIEAQNYWDLTEPKNPVVLEKDDNTQGLVDLSKVNYSSVNLIGGKAANFAELLKIKNPSIPTPENAFAIPFFYYSQHIKNNGIEPFLNQILADENFKTNLEYRQEKLKELQKKILDAPINQELVEMVWSEIDNFKTFEAFRFRSSTNAEDLEFFSGAGLYDSFSAKKKDETKTIEMAIKKVWASLWNIRAFDEREYYKIDQLSAAMGILVHRSFPGEEANGVVITKNLYNINPGFIVNVQFQEHSIVFPEPGILHDQIILFTYSLNPGHNFTLEYLSHSNIPELNGKNVLTDEELYSLGEYCMQIKKHFFYNVPNSCKCLFDDFGLDIEFKIDEIDGHRKLYIKQARIYN